MKPSETTLQQRDEAATHSDAYAQRETKPHRRVPPAYVEPELKGNSWSDAERNHQPNRYKNQKKRDERKCNDNHNSIENQMGEPFRMAIRVQRRQLSQMGLCIHLLEDMQLRRLRQRETSLRNSPASEQGHSSSFQA